MGQDGSGWTNLQAWSSIYFSRQLLAATLQLQGDGVAAPLFIPMGIIVLYLLVEVAPIMQVLDHRFVTSACEGKGPISVEPLYELQYVQSSASGAHFSMGGNRVEDSFVHPDQYQRMYTPLTPNIEAESEASSVRHGDIF